MEDTTSTTCQDGDFLLPKFLPLSLSELVQHISVELQKPKPDMRIVDAAMRAYDASSNEHKRFEHWNPSKKYTRNLIATDHETFTLMLLCWNESQGSPIHSHAGSECFMRIIEGSVVESKYHVIQSNCTKIDESFADITFSADSDNASSSDRTQNSKLPVVELYSHRVASEGSVLFINDTIGVHKIENPFPTRAVTLHCYLPPYESCVLYDENSSETKVGYTTFDTDPFGDW
jgi:cysteine dioxygenase